MPLSEISAADVARVDTGDTDEESNIVRGLD